MDVFTTQPPDRHHDAEVSNLRIPSSRETTFSKTISQPFTRRTNSAYSFGGINYLLFLVVITSRIDCAVSARIDLKKECEFPQQSMPSAKGRGGALTWYYLNFMKSSPGRDGTTTYILMALWDASSVCSLTTETGQMTCLVLSAFPFFHTTQVEGIWIGAIWIFFRSSSRQGAALEIRFEL